MIKGNYIKTCLLVSLVSFLVSLPIVINSNYEVNILSVFNNLFFVPFISFVVYPLSLISLIIKPLDSLLFFIVNNLEVISKYFLSFLVVMPKLSVFEIVLYYVLLIIFFESFNFKYFFIVLLLIILNKYSFYLDSSSYVYSIDVGQGDATLLREKNHAILIDTGGKLNYVKESWMKKKEFHISDNYITFFKSIGIDKLNYLVITHGDADHMGEVINLVNNFKIEKVIFNCGEFNDLENELIKVLNRKKINYYSCIKELSFNKNKLYFLQTKEFDNENDNSNVIYTELNGYNFLFMGDASTITEKEIIDKYNLPNIDVLKVGHHGSKTSSGEYFINEINPKYSVISVGKNNRYGHPNKEVIDNLKNSKIYRTDKQGSIMFKIKNNKLKIETCSP
jgi:competence protein ComEC